MPDSIKSLGKVQRYDYDVRISWQ